MEALFSFWFWSVSCSSPAFHCGRKRVVNESKLGLGVFWMVANLSLRSGRGGSQPGRAAMRPRCGKTGASRGFNAAVVFPPHTLESKEDARDFTQERKIYPFLHFLPAAVPFGGLAVYIKIAKFICNLNNMRS
ncbi:hypothetical protein [Bradyrhizobium sp.]|uniref:hypothetical protein n=1 Tax=Bradyrhizobium sp. TaxID=376 RepID=UPI003C1C57EF